MNRFFPPRSTRQVWQLLASVLHMSNLVFDKLDSEQGEIASISDHEVSSFSKYHRNVECV